MKLWVAGVALLAIAPVYSQELYDPPPTLVRKLIVPLPSRSEIARRNAASYLASYFNGPVTIHAVNVVENDFSVQLKGRVEIKTKSMILQADEVDFDKSTGQLSPRGNVVVKPVTD